MGYYNVRMNRTSNNAEVNSLNRGLLALLLPLLLAAGLTPLRGQSIPGYTFSTGMDSTLWVELTDYQSFIPVGNPGEEPPTEVMPIGFDMWFGSSYHSEFYITGSLNIFLNGGFQQDYYGSSPFRFPTSWMIPASIVGYNYKQGIRNRYAHWKTVGSEGSRTLVIELHGVLSSLADTAANHHQLMQVQLSEADGSLLMLYRNEGPSAGADLGCCFEAGNVAAIRTGDHSFTTVPYDDPQQWPAASGNYRYYRFTPTLRPGCVVPSGTIVHTRTTSAQLQLSRCDANVSCTLSYAPADNPAASVVRNIANPSGALVTLDNLLPGTQYRYILSTDCPAGADFADTGTFMTFCAAEEGNKIRFYDLRDDNVRCHVGKLRVNGSDAIGLVDYGPQNGHSRHSILTVRERDPVISALYNMPEEHCGSVRLGSQMCYAEYESIEYDIDVDTGLYDLLILRYAIVEEMPNHSESEQPRFAFSVLDRNGNLLDNCYYANFAAGFGGAGWNSNAFGNIVWRDWTAAGVDLAPYHGQHIRVKLYNADCRPGGHYGYGYFTLESGSKRATADYCGDADTNIFRAPKGFSYRWYRADAPGVTLSTTDSLAVADSGIYCCRCSYGSAFGQNCGFTIQAVAGSRYPVAAFETEAVDACGTRIRFNNSSVIATDSAHTMLTNVPCETFLWRFDDGTTSTDFSPTHTFSPGDHSVELVAMLANGQCRDSVTHAFTIDPALEATLYDTLCGSSYRFGDTVVAASGHYTHRQQVEGGCDSITHLYLTLRQPPSLDIELQQTCNGDPYYFLDPRDLPDTLDYAWSWWPADAATPFLDADSMLRFVPEDLSEYYLTYRYRDLPACPVTDTLALEPVGFVHAFMELSSEQLSFDDMNLTAFDRSSHATGRQWYLDGSLQACSDAILHCAAAGGSDSLCITLVAFNPSCADTMTRCVSIDGHSIYFPNVFTPGAESNNRFAPIGNIAECELWIYDRRGDIVYHTADALANPWDGTHDGRRCQQGAYVYLCRYRHPGNGFLSHTGTVTMLR